MTRKFDVVIGNPPYQEDSVGDSTHNMPIYHRFMDAAYEVGTKAILITPARFLFNAGYTPKAWNQKMLADPHVSVPVYIQDSDRLFPGTEIMGGVAVTLRDAERPGVSIETFTAFEELNGILRKVIGEGFEPLESVGISTGRSYRYTDLMHRHHPEAVELLSAGHEFVVGPHAFQRLPNLFHRACPSDSHEYIRVLGREANQRVFRWIRREYLTGPDALEGYKAVVPASRNAGGMLGDEPALVTGHSLLLEPGDAVTQTFITIGSFESRAEGEACLNYVQSKFARVMLGILKVTQHNPRSTWKYVPAQDFTSASDIDWSTSIPEIDAQLYAKYGLDADEIAFIESHVKPME